MKNKKLLITTLSIFLIISIMAGVKKANDWFNTHYFIFNQPVNVNVKTPVEVKIRKPQIIEKKIVLSYPEEMIDTPIKKYICEVFGQFECKTAIAVASVEGLNHPPDGFNTNTNGTIDVGYFRINSVHFSKEGCHMEDVIDPYKNVLCAKKLFDQQGWKIWVGYSNGNYLSKL